MSARCAAVKGLLRDFYPWRLEPATEAHAPDALPDALYDELRNPAVHALSMALEQRLTRGEVMRWFVPAGRRLRFRMRLLGDEPEVQQLEEFRERPEGLGVTVSSVHEVRELDLTALYWGVRRMIESLTEDRLRMETAEAFLSAPASPGDAANTTS